MRCDVMRCEDVGRQGPSSSPEKLHLDVFGSSVQKPRRLSETAEGQACGKHDSPNGDCGQGAPPREANTLQTVRAAAQETGP